VLPASISIFEQEFPNATVQIFGMRPGEQLRALSDGKIDIAFTGMSETRGENGLHVRAIASYPVVALLPKRNRLAGRAPLKLRDLDSMFFISMADNGYPGYPAWLIATCEAAGFSPKILEVVENELQVIQAVQSELGVALLPEQIRNVPHGNIRIRNLTPAISINSSVTWQKDNTSPILHAYLETLEKIANKTR
jgi:DNA-binding transcriptional LysR family regulator